MSALYLWFAETVKANVLSWRLGCTDSMMSFIFKTTLSPGQEKNDSGT